MRQASKLAVGSSKPMSLDASTRGPHTTTSQPTELGHSEDFVEHNRDHRRRDMKRNKNLLDSAFLYSGLHDGPVPHDPFTYSNYYFDEGEDGFDTEEWSHSSSDLDAYNHNRYQQQHHHHHHHHLHDIDPGAGGGGRHHSSRHHHRGGMGGDPTLLLTLVRWLRVGSSKVPGDDDLVDRLNYQFTTLIILLLIAVTGLRQYFSRLPLQCWIPQEFSRSWEEYAEHYCWVSNTYFADTQKRLPPPDQRTNVVRYYQWAPFALALQAAGFYLPCLFWQVLKNFSGLNVERIMQGVMRLSTTIPTSSYTIVISGLSRYIDAALARRNHKSWRTLVRTKALPSNKRDASKTFEGKGGESISHGRTGEGDSTVWKNRSSTKPSVGREAKELKGKGKSSLGCLSNCLSLGGDEERRTKIARNKSAKAPMATDPVERSTSRLMTYSDFETNQKVITNNQPTIDRSCLCCSTSGEASMKPKTWATLAGRRVASTLMTCFRVLLTLTCIVPLCLLHCARSNQLLGGWVKRSNRLLFYAYLLVKLTYLVNVVGQIVGMQYFLGAPTPLFGLTILWDLLTGRVWPQTGHFPRVTYCDFETKKNGKNSKYTLQCVLPLNLFLEKIYIFLWFWFIFVGLLTLYNLIKWMLRIGIVNNRHLFVTKYLLPWKLLVDLKQSHEWSSWHFKLKLFINTYLDVNGVFLLRLMSINAGETATSHLISALWDLFLTRFFTTPTSPIPPRRPPVNAAFEPTDLNLQPRVDQSNRVGFSSINDESRIAAYCTMPKRRSSYKYPAPPVPRDQQPYSRSFTIPRSNKQQSLSSSDGSSDDNVNNFPSTTYHPHRQSGLTSSLDSIV